MRGDYLFRCPFCLTRVGSADQSGHLSVNPRKGYWCYRCGAGGRSLQTLRNAANGRLEFGSAKAGGGGRSNVPAPTAIRLYNVKFDGAVQSEAAAYLEGRGLPVSLYEEVGAFVCPDLPKRVVFPVWDNLGLPKFFSARSWVPYYRRYTYPPQRDGWWGKSQCVYAPYMQKTPQHDFNYPAPVILVEGVFDAIALGRLTGRIRERGAALLGTSLSQTQMAWIRGFNPSKVVVLLDSDAGLPAMGVAGRLYKEGFKVEVGKLPAGEDPASASVDALKEALLEAKQVTMAYVAKAALGQPHP